MQYDQTIKWAPRAMANKANYSWVHLNLIAALPLASREAEAHEALQHYLASLSGPKTIAAWKAFTAPVIGMSSRPRYLETFDRYFDGLRKAGMPEGDEKSN